MPSWNCGEILLRSFWSRPELWQPSSGCPESTRFNLASSNSRKNSITHYSSVCQCCLTTDTAVISTNVLNVFLKILQNSQETPGLESRFQGSCRPTDIFLFSCELCEIFYNTFFKEPFGRLLLHKHLFCLLSHHDHLFFQKSWHTYFSVEYFLG